MYGDHDDEEELSEERGLSEEQMERIWETFKFFGVLIYILAMGGVVIMLVNYFT